MKKLLLLLSLFTTVNSYAGNSEATIPHSVFVSLNGADQNDFDDEIQYKLKDSIIRKLFQSNSCALRIRNYIPKIAQNLDSEKIQSLHDRFSQLNDKKSYYRNLKPNLSALVTFSNEALDTDGAPLDTVSIRLTPADSFFDVSFFTSQLSNCPTEKEIETQINQKLGQLYDSVTSELGQGFPNGYHNEIRDRAQRDSER